MARLILTHRSTIMVPEYTHDVVEEGMWNSLKTIIEQLEIEMPFLAFYHPELIRTSSEINGNGEMMLTPQFKFEVFGDEREYNKTKLTPNKTFPNDHTLLKESENTKTIYIDLKVYEIEWLGIPTIVVYNI